MGSLTLNAKAACSSSVPFSQLGWQTSKTGSDYCRASYSQAVVHRVANAPDANEYLKSCNPSVDIYMSSGTCTGAVVKCYLYDTDPTLTDVKSPPSGYVAVGTVQKNLSTSATTVTFSFTGLNITAEMVYFWYNVTGPTGSTLLYTGGSGVSASAPDYSVCSYGTLTAYTVTAEAGDNIGSVTGGGSYTSGASCTVSAVLGSASGYTYAFDGWYDGDDKVSSSQSYTFTVTGNVTLEAVATRTRQGADMPTITDLETQPDNSGSDAAHTVIRSWGSVYVQSYSKANISFEYTVGDSTSLQAVSVTCNGETVQNTSVTSGVFSGVSSVITIPGTIAIIATVTDALGQTVSETESITVLEYSPPSLESKDVIRYSDDPDEEDKTDEAVNLSAKAAMRYSSVNGNNSGSDVRVRVRYRPVTSQTYPDVFTNLVSGNTSHVKINTEDLSTDVTYIVQFCLYDKLHAGTQDLPAITVEYLVSTRSVVIHAKDGGAGFAVGGYNTLDAFQVWFKTYLYNSLICGNGSGIYGGSLPETGNSSIGQLFFLTSGNSGWQTVTPYIYLGSSS